MEGCPVDAPVMALKNILDDGIPTAKSSEWTWGSLSPSSFGETDFFFSPEMSQTLTVWSREAETTKSSLGVERSTHDVMIVPREDGQTGP